MRLLCLSYPNGLPDDDEQLSKLSGLNEAWFNGSSTTLRSCFVIKKGKLFNTLLMEEYKNYKKWQEKSREGGIQSGKARREKAKSLKGASTTLEPPLNEKSRVEKNREVVEKDIKEKIYKKESRHEQDAAAIYEYYKLKVKPGASADAKRNIIKLLKTKQATKELLINCIDNYKNSTKFEKDEYKYQANNFFGLKAYWQDYIDAPIVQAEEEYDQLADRAAAEKLKEIEDMIENRSTDETAEKRIREIKSKL